MTKDDVFHVGVFAKEIADMRPQPVRVILSDIHDAESGLFEAVWYSKAGDRDSSAMCVSAFHAELSRRRRAAR
jgi:hypothetical protein